MACSSCRRGGEQFQYRPMHGADRIPPAEVEDGRRLHELMQRFSLGPPSELPWGKLGDEQLRRFQQAAEAIKATQLDTATRRSREFNERTKR